MRRATIALLIALATMFGGSAAGASTGSPLGLDQSQVGNNTNQTGQQSKATASTDQLNLNIPISVLSPGANSGDVDQSNRSDTYVVSVNENGSTQSVDQSQQGQVGRSGHGSGSGLDQSQEAANTNETSQDSSAEATTYQANVNAPVAILSPGANSGDVDQSNHADTEVWSANSNNSDQSVDQTQQGKVEGSEQGAGCKKDCGRDHCPPSRAGKSNCSGHRPDRDHDRDDRCKCQHGDQRHLSQSQEAANTNETEQASEAKATTEQTNVNLPISILEFGSHDRHDGKSHDGKRGHDGHGKGDHDRKGDGYDKDRGHDHGRPDMGRSGDVSQSNSADTSVVSYNANDSVQSIDQIQQGGIGNGSGGSHSGQPRCCA